MYGLNVCINSPPVIEIQRIGNKISINKGVANLDMAELADLGQRLSKYCGSTVADLSVEAIFPNVNGLVISTLKKKYDFILLPEVGTLPKKLDESHILPVLEACLKNNLGIIIYKPNTALLH